MTSCTHGSDGCHHLCIQDSHTARHSWVTRLSDAVNAALEHPQEGILWFDACETFEYPQVALQNLEENLGTMVWDVSGLVPRAHHRPKEVYELYEFDNASCQRTLPGPNRGLCSNKPPSESNFVTIRGVTISVEMHQTNKIALPSSWAKSLETTFMAKAGGCPTRAPA